VATGGRIPTKIKMQKAKIKMVVSLRDDFYAAKPHRHFAL
jgi:hypothetical protein